MARKAEALREPPAPPVPAVVPVDFQHDTDERLVTPADIQRWLGVSRSSVYELMNQKPPRGLPKPVKIGRASRWRLGTLRRWFQERERATARRN